MEKYRKKPIVIEAEQWWGFINENVPISKYYADVVKEVCKESPCKHCGCLLKYHGWIDTLEGGHIVCPGDWIIKGIKGEYHPCKDKIFKLTYEKVEE